MKSAEVSVRGKVAVSDRCRLLPLKHRLRSCGIGFQCRINHQTNVCEFTAWNKPNAEGMRYFFHEH